MKSNVCIALLAVAAVSCKTPMYFPDRVNAPGFSEKYQGFVNFSMQPQTSPEEGPTGKAASFSTDLGFSITDNIAVIGSYRDLNDNAEKEKDNNVNRVGGIFNGTRREIGLGYYRGNKKGLNFEAFAGLGKGDIRRTSPLTPHLNFNSDYSTWFLQTAVGQNWDYFRILFGAKYFSNRYYGFTATEPNLRYSLIGPTGSGKGVTDQTFAYISPFLNVEAGYKFFMFSWQMGATAQVAGDATHQNPFYMTLGMTFRLGPEMFRDLKK